MDRAAAQRWVDDFLTRRPDAGESHQRALAPQAAAAPVPGENRPFSPFVPSDVEQSAGLHAELSNRAAGAETPEQLIAAISGHLESAPE
jgi:hypothetical protein